MKIIEKVFKEMEKKSINATTMAEHLRINKSVISNWKKRNTNPPAELIVPICELLEITPNYLLGFNEKEVTKDEIYNKLSNEDKEIVDIIFKKYQELQAQKSSDLKIG